LPLRSYGLRFVLQADWQVPSSRESVDADSCWNQALRDEVPGMLLAAMHAFMSLADGDSSSSTSVDAASTGSGNAQQQQQQQQDAALPLSGGVAGNASLSFKLSREAWIDCWLHTLPLEGQAQGFFAALPHR
jgi:hypothetical protein